MSASIYGSFSHNLIFNTDSYKVSHWRQYPPDTQGLFAYVESRGGMYPETVFFGLQAFLKEYLTRPVTPDMLAEAEAFFSGALDENGTDRVGHLPGVPFNREGWLRVIHRHGGYLPLVIRAVPEGSVLPVKNALVTCQSTDPALPWLASYIETALLRAIWYGSTVATRSWRIKGIIGKSLAKTADDLAGLPFKLHDFGARGASSQESAALGGAAHLVNFRGSDTVSGVLAANRYYGAGMSAFSIAAAEHSTITAWGREQEVEAYRNMVAQFARPGSLFAVVSDSYDLFHAVEKLWGEELRTIVANSGATLVVRPDSGDPAEVLVQTARMLADKFGTTVNGKGYKVLNHVRIIQGDGVNEHSIEAVLQSLTGAGFSADNVAFGMGGVLLQQLNRDTQKFAMKTSAVLLGNGDWCDVYKDPVTDPGKSSKRGRLACAQRVAAEEGGGGRGQGHVVTVRLDQEGKVPAGYRDLMRTVYRDGRLLVDDTLNVIRERAEGIAVES